MMKSLRVCGTETWNICTLGENGLFLATIFHFALLFLAEMKKAQQSSLLFGCSLLRGKKSFAGADGLVRSETDMTSHSSKAHTA